MSSSGSELMNNILGMSVAYQEKDEDEDEEKRLITAQISNPSPRKQRPCSCLSKTSGVLLSFLAVVVVVFVLGFFMWYLHSPQKNKRKRKQDIVSSSQ